MHYGQVQPLYDARQAVLDAAFRLNPDRFTQRHPAPLALSTKVGINWSKPVATAASDALPSTLNFQQPVSHSA